MTSMGQKYTKARTMKANTPQASLGSHKVYFVNDERPCMSGDLADQVRSSSSSLSFRSLSPYLYTGLAKKQRAHVTKAFQDIVSFLSILVVAGFVLWLLFHHSVHMGASIVHSMTSPIELTICKDDAAIKHLQSRQLRLARLELFSGRNAKAFTSASGDDMGFYTRNYGAMTVKTEMTKKGFNRIMYYRIWKSAGNALRRVLHAYATGNGYNERDWRVCRQERKNGRRVDCFAKSEVIVFINLIELPSHPLLDTAK